MTDKGWAMAMVTGALVSLGAILKAYDMGYSRGVYEDKTKERKR